MKAYVAVTDHDWFRFLRSRPELDEVNFWRPSDRRFKAIEQGGPFLFKLRSPQNAIVGGGIFSRFYQLPLSLAWTAFEETNGAASLPQMRRLIEGHLKRPVAPGEDFTIGCLILQGAVFLREELWIPVPSGFTGNSPGKTFDAEREPIASIWERLQVGIATSQPSRLAERPLFGDPRLYQPRLGQGSFRIEVGRTYLHRCAVSGEKALPTLDAAHIRPVSEGGQHRLDNGLFLRSDIHRLFDRGYVTVDTDRRFRVSRSLRDDFDNGEPYFPLDRKEISLPARLEHRPSREFLEWHGDVVFRG